VIGQLLPGGKPDVGTFDVRGSRIALDGIFRFLGLRRRGLRGPAGEGKQQRDQEGRGPKSLYATFELPLHRQDSPLALRLGKSITKPLAGRMNFQNGQKDFHVSEEKIFIAAPVA
jgi:hypothetical protein